MLVGACGGDDDAGPPPVLDNARAVVAEARRGADLDSVDADTDTTRAASDEVEVEVEVDELPPPDPTEFVGANRVVNLWVGADGETQTIDVWGRRTFTNGPVLLASDVGFGAASEHFAAPPGYRLVVVGSGAGPDGAELADLFNASDGERITTIYTNDDEAGSVWAPNLWETDPTGSADAPVPPDDALGVVVLYAPNTRSFSDSLIAAVGGDSFYVGDGSGECRTQRMEDEGFQPDILGGTARVELELPPGPARLTLHPWFSPDECAQPPVLDLTVEVEAGEMVMVLVHSRDGESVDALQLPMG